MASNTRADGLEEAAAMLESWAEVDEKTGELAAAATLRVAVSCIRGLKDRAARQKCECQGCTKEVPAFWRAGLCWPCATEDCEHDESEVAHAG